MIWNDDICTCYCELWCAYDMQIYTYSKFVWQCLSYHMLLWVVLIHEEHRNSQRHLFNIFQPFRHYLGASKLPGQLSDLDSFPQIDESIDLKAASVKACPVINTVETYRQAWRNIWTLGGPRALRDQLKRQGFLKEGSNKLTTSLLAWWRKDPNPPLVDSINVYTGVCTVCMHADLSFLMNLTYIYPDIDML